MKDWMSYVSICVVCETIMVESPAGQCVFSACAKPRCGGGIRRLSRLEAHMREASGYYNGDRHTVAGFHEPFWISKQP
jgi:hypothetical protein